MHTALSLLPPPPSTYLPQPWYKTRGGGTAWQSSIYLPPNAYADSPIEGPYMTNSKAAKNAAALAAIRALYGAGRMNDCLHPSWVSPRYSKQLGEWGVLGGGGREGCGCVIRWRWCRSRKQKSNETPLHAGEGCVGV